MQFYGKEKRESHVSIWRQKTRLRVYINEEKVWDLPRVCDRHHLQQRLFHHRRVSPVAGPLPDQQPQTGRWRTGYPEQADHRGRFSTSASSSIRAATASNLSRTVY